MNRDDQIKNIFKTEVLSKVLSIYLVKIIKFQKTGLHCVAI